MASGDRRAEGVAPQRYQLHVGVVGQAAQQSPVQITGTPPADAVGRTRGNQFQARLGRAARELVEDGVQPGSEPGAGAEADGGRARGSQVVEGGMGPGDIGQDHRRRRRHRDRGRHPNRVRSLALHAGWVRTTTEMAAQFRYWLELLDADTRHGGALFARMLPLAAFGPGYWRWYPASRAPGTRRSPPDTALRSKTRSVSSTASPLSSTSSPPAGPMRSPRTSARHRPRDGLVRLFVVSPSTSSGFDLSCDVALDLCSHAGRQRDQTFELFLRLPVGVLRSAEVAPSSIASRNRLWARTRCSCSSRVNPPRRRRFASASATSNAMT